MTSERHELTAGERAAGRERSLAARRRAAAARSEVRQGRRSPRDSLAARKTDAGLAPMRLRTFLLAVPGVGVPTAEAIIRESGVGGGTFPFLKRACA